MCDHAQMIKDSDDAILTDLEKEIIAKIQSTDSIQKRALYLILKDLALKNQDTHLFPKEMVDLITGSSTESEWVYIGMDKVICYCADIYE